jgi:hypothetical protein
MNVFSPDFKKICSASHPIAEPKNKGEDEKELLANNNEN